MMCRHCNRETTNPSFCSCSCAVSYTNSRRKLSVKTRGKISKSLKGKPLSAAHKKKLSDAAKSVGHWWGRERVAVVESSCLCCGLPIQHRVTEKRKYHKHCWLKSSGGYRENSTIKHQSVYNGYKMDSGAELVFAKLLDEHKVRWEKNKTRFFYYYDVNGVRRRYYPDFYLFDYDWWVEIKGKFYKSDNDKLKLQSVGNIELIMSDNIRLPKVVLGS